MVDERRGLDELVFLAIVEVHLARGDQASAATVAREFGPSFSSSRTARR